MRRPEPLADVRLGAALMALGCLLALPGALARPTEGPAASTWFRPHRVEINTAPVGELMALPGVGRVLAERIAADRPFGSLEDLGRVHGIGPAAQVRLAAYVSFSGG